MIDKCIAPHCKGSATKNSDYCLSHAIEVQGAFALIEALNGNLMPDIYYPPVERAMNVHERLIAKIKQGAR